ncbi:RNaseH domain-containing protein [Amycolatopsis orientalis]|uniref:RNaseH domain-containing protein n=1 Tax=Amycolatopsis orientalis TaxID=31958 RepID=UPI001F2C6B28|nr:RNaseH domain-containing protein [Amycolatopsis orientalis]
MAPTSTGTERGQSSATPALTARLCQQAASWGDRTQNPTPLHLAERPDLDHPQRAEQPEEADTAE